MTTATTDLEQFTRDFYREIDADDPNVFKNRFATEAVFAFNDVNPVAGIDSIEAFVAAWKGNFKAVIHGLQSLTVDTANSSVGIEIAVTYVFPDGNEVTVKGASFVHFTDSSISQWNVYVDTSRLS